MLQLSSPASSVSFWSGPFSAATGVQEQPVCARVSVHLYVYICLWGTQTERLVPGVNSGQSHAWIPARSRIQGPRDPGPTSRPADALVMTELPAANERVGLVLPAEFRSHSAS